MKSEAVAAAREVLASMETTRPDEVARSIPGAASIFQKYAFDPAAIGEAKLGDWARALGILEQSFAEELRELARIVANADAERDALIGYILIRFHDAHRDELPALVELANRVEARHRDHPMAPRGLALLLDELNDVIQVHLQNEESLLLSMMRHGEEERLIDPMAHMCCEHDEQEARIARIEANTFDLNEPVDACDAWRALYAGIRKLTVELRDHMRLENDVLFPSIARASLLGRQGGRLI